MHRITPINSPAPADIYFHITPKTAKKAGIQDFQNFLNTLTISRPTEEVQRRIGNRMASSDIMIKRSADAIKQTQGDLKITFKAQHAYWSAMGKAAKKCLQTFRG